MTGKFLGKLVLTVVVLVWAVSNLIPLEDTPFDYYIKTRATAREGEFAEVLVRANKRVDEGKAPSLFVAMNQLGSEDRVDYAVFFPDVNLADVKDLDRRNEILLQHLLKQSQGKIKLGLDLKGGVAFTLKIDDASLGDKQSFQKEQQLGKAINIMERRINGLGIAEAVVRARGEDQIEIQMPGLTTRDNPDVLANLRKPAKLKFHRVHREKFPNHDCIGEVPVGYEVKTLENVDSGSGEIYDQKLFVKRVPDMGGSMVKNAFATMNQYGGFEISLAMTDPEGARRFAEITENIEKENVKFASLPDNAPGRYGRLAIVLDDQLYSAPTVRHAIHGGRASISGNFSQREALELANVLNNPLEFELKLEEMYEVSPTLAEGAKDASISAALFGGVLVMLFMLIYYLSAGLVAVISLVLNLVIVLGVMASLGSTLTLPGVAALVLTVGMAVDSNILIFERIREELKLGKDVKTALLAGFEKAFSTIFDANITTLLTAGILIWLGTGPVKGFGVTLSIGIAATMFCALVVSRLFLEILVDANLIKRLVPITLFKESKFDFLNYRKPAFLVSWIIVIGGVIALMVHKDHIYGIDFMGGDEMRMKFQEKLQIQDIYEVAADQNLGEVVPNYQSLLGGKQDIEVLKVQTEVGQGLNVVAALKQKYPDAGLELIGENTIGASVSDSIKYNALLALAVSLVGILLYVALRFKFGYGMGAVVSTVHDVLMSVGIFVILGGQFTAPMVAAVLMIVGYSINDTIVVFDRTREELELNPGLTLKQIINLAINRTLSRTMLTSITTLMSALALFIFGAGVVKDFALVFIIGIVTGTFSSIFIASPVFFWWHKGDRKHVESKELKSKYAWDVGGKEKE